MLITGKDNPKVKLYKKLCASKKTRDETGLFAAEGMRSCIDLVKLERELKTVRITALFYTERAIERCRGQLPVELLESFDPSRRFEITDAVAEKMSEVGKTQGAFVIAEKPDRTLRAEEIDPLGKYLVLCDIQDPGNLGTMLRTAAAVGLDGMVIAGNCVDLYNPKVVRSAMGSIPRVKIYLEEDALRALEILGGRGIKTCAAVVSGGKSAREFDFSGGCAVVIGNEGRGLSAEQADICAERVTIKMKGSMDSLNAAIAGTILLWEMSKGG